jgi:hypothetical protein
LSSDIQSDASSEAVCTKVVQGEKYDNPDGWSSDDNAMAVQPKVAAPKATKENTAENKQGKDYDAFIKVTNRNNKKQTKKQKMIAETTNADRMERANRLLQSTDHESDYKENSKTDKDTHQSKYKREQMAASVPKLPKTTTQKNNHMKGQDVSGDDANEMDGEIDSSGLAGTHSGCYCGL